MDSIHQRRVTFSADHLDYLLATAARAPSVHNMQPWQFRLNEVKIEMFADPTRKLRHDAVGREMLLSCGAALFGLRLAIRSLGYYPQVKLLPDPSQLRLLASVSARPGPPMTDVERAMLQAVPYRHTHRGPFANRSLPLGLSAALQQDALAENATLSFVRKPIEFNRLAEVVWHASAAADLDPTTRDEIRRWTRPPGSPARDGIPAEAFCSGRSQSPSRLRQRDFDLGRGLGAVPADGSDLVSTAVLLTFGDRRLHWLYAGQALQRLLLHAASSSVHASIYTQPLEVAAYRTQVARCLGLPGSPQVLLQLGHADITGPTSRRRTKELLRSKP
jgi:hypothetical protein